MEARSLRLTRTGEKTSVATTTNGKSVKVTKTHEGASTLLTETNSHRNFGSTVTGRSAGINIGSSLFESDSLNEVIREGLARTRSENRSVPPIDVVGRRFEVTGAWWTPLFKRGVVAYEVGISLTEDADFQMSAAGEVTYEAVGLATPKDVEAAVKRQIADEIAKSVASYYRK